jgi:hypothetical protein
MVIIFTVYRVTIPTIEVKASLDFPEPLLQEKPLCPSLHRIHFVSSYSMFRLHLHILAWGSQSARESGRGRESAFTERRNLLALKH